MSHFATFGIHELVKWLCFVFVLICSSQRIRSVQWLSHPRRPRGSQSGRVKRREESFQAWAEKPLGTDSHRTISKRSRESWFLIGHKKMLCIIVPNRRTASPEFFSWDRTRLLLSRHSCPVRSPSLPNQKRRNYRWVEKRFGCYQQEQFNLHWENSVSDGSQCIVNNRKFKMKRRRESKKSNSLTRQNNNFARASRFFVYFFAVTARLRRENA